MEDDVLHAIDCDCQKCLDQWVKIEKGISPSKCLCIHAFDGYETYKIDENTIGVRPFWHDAKVKPPRKDIPILVVTEFCEMPDVVRWLEEGTYGEPGFFESNDEYETKEADILFWMPSPEIPK